MIPMDNRFVVLMMGQAPCDIDDCGKGLAPCDVVGGGKLQEPCDVDEVGGVEGHSMCGQPHTCTLL